jgi:diaminopropionate ammonia-lyase
MPWVSDLARMAAEPSVIVNMKRISAPSELMPLAGHIAAMREIASWPEFQITPLHRLNAIARLCQIQELWYKDESSRLGLGSFKALGGAYAVLRVLQEYVKRRTGREPASDELRNGALGEITRDFTVTTATDGNHGRSVAWGARLFNCDCVVYVPKACSAGRESAIAKYGARVVRTDVGYDETVRLCAREALRHGRTVVSDTSWPGYVDIPREIMQGYTVLIEEVLQQLPCGKTLTHIFVQAGVGGLAAAVCGHLANRFNEAAPAVIVVEPEGAACLYASAKAGKPTPAPFPVTTIMAGLECGEVSPLAWEVLCERAVAFMTIPDYLAAPCMRLLAVPRSETQPIVAGESAVAGLAALMLASRDSAIRALLELTTKSSVLVIGTEGATDPDVYRALVERSPFSVRSRK